MRQQIGQAAGLGVVVAALFVGQQQAGVLARAPWRRAGRIRDRAEWRWRAASAPCVTAILNSVIISSVISFLSTPLRGGQRFLQAAALIHGGGGDDAGFVGQRLHVLQLTCGQSHLSLLLRIPELDCRVHLSQPPEIGLGARDIAQNLRLQRFRTLELPLVAQPPEKLHADRARRFAGRADRAEMSRSRAGRRRRTSADSRCW